MAPRPKKAKEVAAQELPTDRIAPCYMDRLEDELLEQCLRQCFQRCQRMHGILSQVSQRWRNTTFLSQERMNCITNDFQRCMEEGPAFSLYEFTVDEEDPKAGTFGSDGTPSTAKYRPAFLETLAECPWLLQEVCEFRVENVSLLCNGRNEICNRTVTAVLKLICTEGVMPRLRGLKLNLWHESEYLDADQVTLE